MAAVQGYLILSGSSHDPPLLYAMVFGIVGGMMVYISIQVCHMCSVCIYALCVRQLCGVAPVKSTCLSGLAQSFT